MKAVTAITTKAWQRSQTRRHRPQPTSWWSVLALSLLGAATPAAAATSGGTGFFLGSGRLVTAAHVVAGCGVITVVPEGSAALTAEVAARDPELDLAVLRVPGARFADPGLADDAAAGSAFTALGYPAAGRGGPLRALPLVVIELPVPRPSDRLPLHGDLAEPGMSGAPLVDARGRVAGMLLGRGDAAAPGAVVLARRLGYPVEEIAIALPSRWLPASAAAAKGRVVVARVLCQSRPRGVAPGDGPAAPVGNG
jgi:S1-C subfamily serine protease